MLIADEAFAPGETGTIKATFNSSGKSGKQTKLITVITNCPDDSKNKILLKITGEVVK